MQRREALVRHGDVPPRPLNGKAPRYSASTVKSHKRCPRKHFFEQACGIETPVTAALADGTRLHGLIERYIEQRRRPEDDLSNLWPVVKTGLHHLPEPGTPGLLVEVPRRMATWPGGPEFTGTPDLMQVKNVDHFIEVDLHDHKSTSGYARGAKMGWVLTPQTLPDDVQNICYSTFAFKQLDATAVNSQWIYYDKKGLPATSVKARMERVATLKKWREEILPIIGEMQEQHEQRPARIADVEPRGLENGECESYGGCPHRAYCHKFIKGGMTVLKGEKTVSENPLLARLNAQVAKPKVEEPEPAPVPTEPEPTPAPPAAPPAARALAMNPPPVQAAAPTPAPAEAAPAEEKRGRGRPRKDAAGPQTQAEVDVAAVLASQDEDHTKLAAAKASKSEAPPAGVGFNFYIGCRPARGSAREEVNVLDLLKPYCDNVSKVNGKYWQCVDYGQGAKQVAALLQSALDSGVLSLSGKSVISPLIGPEAELAKSILWPRAQAVVERFA